MDWHKYFIYEPETGDLIHRVRDSINSGNERCRRSWNSRYAGKVACSVRKRDGYKRAYVYQSSFLVHRIVWEMTNGPIPSGVYVDHIDGNPNNSRIENLRLCNQSQNLANSKLSKSSKTGHKGVFYDPANKKYRAALRVRGVNVLEKRYHTLEEAVAARNEAARAHQGEFFRLA
jgi:hypothetical protein